MRASVPRLSLGNLLKGAFGARDGTQTPPAQAAQPGNLPKVTFDLPILDSQADRLDMSQAKPAGGLIARDARDSGGSGACRGSLSARGWGDRTQEGRRASYAGDSRHHTCKPSSLAGC